MYVLGSQPPPRKGRSWQCGYHALEAITSFGCLGNSTCRSAKLLPKQGDKSPWRGGVNYIVDMIRLAVGGLRTDSLEFTHLPKPNPPPTAATLPVLVELDPLSSIIRSAGESRSVGGGGGSVSLRCRIPEENHNSKEESRTR